MTTAAAAPAAAVIRGTRPAAVAAHVRQRAALLALPALVVDDSPWPHVEVAA